jgi:hypothetical protein
MSLVTELAHAAKEISTDGYDMSFGELLSLYRETELIINPDFQRLFRWEPWQKTKFIESVLLGIPIPPIFVYQNKDGVWELVDGLQRLSTVFEFMGELRTPEGTIFPGLELTGTRMLPSLDGKVWDGEDNNPRAVGKAQQLTIKRSRVRVEILKKESDPRAKFELFQRLNTGGTVLTPQEIRNCTLVMLNKPFYEWLRDLSEFPAFTATTDQTDVKQKRGINMELVVRYFVFRKIPYEGKLDVHEYIDEGMLKLASEHILDLPTEAQVFKDTFTLLADILGSNVFKKYDNGRHVGMFLMSGFEVIATGVSKNLQRFSANRDLLKQKIQDLWGNSVFKDNSGAGVRGTTRLTNLLPFSEQYFE